MARSLHFAKKVELSLGEFINVISREHNNQAVVELTREFIINSESREIHKKGLDFFYMNGLYDDLRWLINKNKEYADPLNQNWAYVYQLMLDRLFEHYVPQEFLEQINHIHSNETELNCLLGIAKTTAYFDWRDYEQVGSLLMSLTSLFEGLEDIYLRASFKTVLYAYLFRYYWIRNELIIARKYAYKALNKQTSPNNEVQLHACLGLSYTFDTYFQGMYHLTKALKIAKTHHLTNHIFVLEQRYIPFLCAHFKQTEGIQSTLIRQQAQIEIANGNNEKAVEILRTQSLENPFVLYYLGVASRDKQLLRKSYTYFIEKESNYFFSRLPLNALQNLNV